MVSSDLEGEERSIEALYGAEFRIRKARNLIYGRASIWFCLGLINRGPTVSRTCTRKPCGGMYVYAKTRGWNERVRKNISV